MRFLKRPARAPTSSPSGRARRRRLLAALGLATLLAAGCTASRRVDGPPSAPRTVAERYVSAPRPGEELDSLAAWDSPAGVPWLIASGKARDRLSVFDADSGRWLRAVGGPGTEAGRFDRPNGLAVAGDLLFVVERDNHRVQVLRLPGFEPLATFGAGLLRSPYGIWLNPTGPGALDAYVTDSFMYGERFDVVPPLPELAQRVRRFRLRIGPSGVAATVVGSFGDTTAAGALRMVESIGGDRDHDRLLVADEATGPDGRRSTLREYTLDGRYTGRGLPEGSFDAEAEGVALWRCPDGGGYWIAVDQLTPLTRFHVFGRRDLRLRGTWQGRATAGTDGIALRATPSPAFPGGALFAVHADRAVAAFDLRDIVRALALDPACLR